MNLLFALFFASVSRAQLVSLVLCSDNGCSNNCESAFVNVGQCYAGAVPYRLVHLDALTFYSDGECRNVIPTQNNMMVFMDSGCKTLYGANDKKMGSYKASNMGAIIGGLVGGLTLVTGICLLACCLDRDVKKRRVENLTVEPVVVSKRANLSINPFYAPEQYFTRTNRPNSVYETQV
jgi:hypothetical protein